MSREQTIERLRIWARRAQDEAQQADTRADILNWQGQAQALGDLATFLVGPGAQLDDRHVWKQVVFDRSKAITAWDEQQNGPEAMYYSGLVAGYDTALTVLRDVTGKTWPRTDPLQG